MAAFSKILKNTTVSPITLKKLGITVPALGQITVDRVEYPYLSSVDRLNEINPLITSGDIVINNGVIDLSVSEGIRFIEYADRLDTQKTGTSVTKTTKTIDFKTGPFDVVDSGDGKTTVSLPSDFGDIAEDDRLIHVECVPGTNCVQDVTLLIDDTLCFIKHEEC